MKADMVDQIEPYDDYIAVKPLDAESVTASGLIIAGVEDRGHPLRGTVLRLGKGAIGKDGARIPIEAQVGDEIYFSRGTEVELAEGLTLVKEGKILVTVRDGEIIPYWDKVVVELTSDSGENASGIYIASDQQATFDKGTVVAVGSGMTDRGKKTQMELETGMSVAFNQFEGVELDLGMEDMRRLYVTREKHVYGILT